jgi:MFS family permease
MEEPQDGGRPTPGRPRPPGTRRHGRASRRLARLEEELSRRLNGTAGARCSCARAAALAVTGLVLLCDGQEMLVMGLVTPHLRRQWQLEPMAEGSLGASVFAGVLVGSLVGGVLSDAIGRRPSLLIFAGLLLSFGVAAAFAPNLAVLIALRSLAGLALGGTLPITSALIAEVSSDKWRGPLIVLGGVGFALGEMVTAAEAVVIDLYDGDRNWRVLMAISAVPALLCLVVGVIFLHESPRWCVASCRVAAAPLSWCFRGCSPHRRLIV